MERKRSSLFWSDSHVIPEQERIKLDSWFYDHLFSPDQYELTLDYFDCKHTLFQRDLQGNSMIELLLYAQGKPFDLNPKSLAKKLQERIIKFDYNKEVYWFTCYQSTTYHHDVGLLGTYSFEKHPTSDDINGELFPVFANLIVPDMGRELDHDYKLCSGLLDKDKKWMLLITLDNEEKQQLTIKIAGDANFCTPL